MSNGFTVHDYLRKKRTENPEYAQYSNMSLYQKLRDEGDAVPEWESANTYRDNKSKRKRAYEQKQNPDFVNSLYDWTDWTIDENSWDWVKSAYNNSMTGLAYQLYNKQQRFALDENYNPGIVEDVGSAVLSFLMPLDMATFAFGGWAAKGVMAAGGNTLARKGLKHAAMTNLMKTGGFTKKTAALREVNKMLKVNSLASKGGGMAGVMRTGAPRAAGMIGQGTTLAVFEGARGGMQASADGTDLWEGIGHGVMHGGVMGGLAGFAGASLNIKHAAKWNKKTGPLTPKQQAHKFLSGPVKQVGVEAGVFTLPDVYKAMTDEDYSARDVIRNLVVNAGMMGILKAKHGLMAKGGKEIKQLKDDWIKNDAKNVKANKNAFEKVEEAQAEVEDIPVEPTKEARDKILYDAIKDKTDYTMEEVESWEPLYNRAVEHVNDYKIGALPKGTSLKDTKVLNKLNKDLEVIDEVKNALLMVNGAIKENLTKEEAALVPVAERIKYLKDLESDFLKLNNEVQSLEVAKNEAVGYDRDIASMKVEAELGDIRAHIKDNLKGTRKKEAQKFYKEQIEAKVIRDDVSGKISEEQNFNTLKIAMDTYKATYKAIEKPIEGLKLPKTEREEKPMNFLSLVKDPVSKKDETYMFKRKQKEIEGREVEYFDEVTAGEFLKEVKEGKWKPKGAKSIGHAERILDFEALIHESSLSDKIHKKQAGRQYSENRFIEKNPTELQESKYNESKQIIKRFARENLVDKKNIIEDALEHIKVWDKFARELAKDNKSFRDMSNIQFENFAYGNPKSYKPALSMLAQQLSKLNVSKNTRGILKEDFTYITGTDIGKLYLEVTKGAKTEGLLSTAVDFGGAKYEGNIITIGTKTDVKQKPVTPELVVELKNLDLAAKESDKIGHKDFLLRDTKGEALTDVDMNAMVKQYLGERKTPAGGEARAFRYGYLAYIEKAYGRDSIEYQLIDSYTLGHKVSKEIADRYSKALDLTKEHGTGEKGVHNYIVEIHRKWKDAIKKGKFKNINGETISLERVKEGLSKGKIEGDTGKKTSYSEAFRTVGYYPEEIKIGLANIAKEGNVITIKKTGKQVDKKTVETALDFMIQTAPRIREIAPTKQTVQDHINYYDKPQSQKLKIAEAEAGDIFSEGRFLGELPIEQRNKRLSQMAKWAEKTHRMGYGQKGLKVKLQDVANLSKTEGEYVVGKLTGHIAEVASRSAVKDAIPHETSHHTINVLKSVGDPYSKKLIKDGIKLFGSEEKLVTALGEYTYVQKFMKPREAFEGVWGEMNYKKWQKLTNMKFYGGQTMFGRMKNWIRRVVSHFQNLFELKRPEDVVRMRKEIVGILGEKVIRGDYPMAEYIPDASKIDYLKLNNSTKKGFQEKQKINTRIHAKGGAEAEAKEYGMTEIEKLEIRRDIFGEDKLTKKSGTSYSVNDPAVTVQDFVNYENALQNWSLNKAQGGERRAPINANKLEGVRQLEVDYNISEKAAENWFKEMYNTTQDKASDLQIKVYRDVIIQFPKIKETSTTLTSHIRNLMSSQGKYGSFPVLKRAVMTTGDVLEKWGGNVGRKIKETLQGHDFWHTRYAHEGYAEIHKIKRIVPKKIQKKYMDMVDMELGKSDIESMETLLKQKEYANNKGLQREFSEMKDAYKKFSKGGELYDARVIWNKLTDYYWEQYGVNAARHVKGRGLKEIKKELASKYIENYFPRKLTKKAFDALNPSNKTFRKITDESFQKIGKNKDELKKLVKKADFGDSERAIVNKKIKNGEKLNNEEVEVIKTHMAEEMYDALIHGPTSTTVRPSWLQERGVALDRYIEVNKPDGGKELIKTYESSLDGTMNFYAAGMGKYLSTVRYFPEWTQVGGKFSLKGKEKRRIIEAFAEDKSGEFGDYALLAIKQQLGLDYNSRSRLNSKYHTYMGRITNVSAWMGLSSPMSGIKNVLMQIPRSAAVYGVRNTFRAISYASKVMRNPGGKEYSEAIRKGQIGYGIKQILSETPTAGAKMKWWFDNVNLMTKTENFNRIVAAEAAQMHFTALLSKARGESSMFWPGENRAEIMRMFKETFKLDSKMMETLKNKKDLYNSKEFQDVLDWVGFQGHKASAGATGTIDLPLWMQNKYAKPFTLFQRIATSVTIDSYKNYLKPMQNGNIAPLIKATIGHGLSGMLLYSMYDKFLGQQPPKEDSPAVDRMMSYLWRGEALGVFSDGLSPYESRTSFLPIMEPIIIRNFSLAAQEFSNIWNARQPVQEALNDGLKKTLVIYGQAERGWNNINHPYVTGTKRIKTLEKQWRKNKGYKEPTMDTGLASEMQYHYIKLKEAIMFGKSDSDIALAYYKAYNSITQELETVEGITSKWRREKEAKRRLKLVVKKMNPLSINKDQEGRYGLISLRTEFLNSLSRDNKSLAEKLAKEYEYKVRAYEKIIGNRKWKEQFSIYPY